jgi:hypothetical protein
MALSDDSAKWEPSVNRQVIGTIPVPKRMIRFGAINPAAKSNGLWVARCQDADGFNYEAGNANYDLSAGSGAAGGQLGFACRGQEL